MAPKHADSARGWLREQSSGKARDFFLGKQGTADGKARTKSLLTHRLLQSSQGWLPSRGFLSLLENFQHRPPPTGFFPDPKSQVGERRAQRLLLGYALGH